LAKYLRATRDFKGCATEVIFENSHACVTLPNEHSTMTWRGRITLDPSVFHCSNIEHAGPHRSFRFTGASSTLQGTAFSSEHLGLGYWIADGSVRCGWGEALC
jgi:hypothetical protein